MAGMGLSRIGYTNDKVTEYFAWNPFGAGCSRGCPDCWARACAKRMKCPDCRAFIPHVHPERMDWPSQRKKPSFVLCNFTNDWLDAERPPWDIGPMARAMFDAARHTYITLTQRPRRLQDWALTPLDIYHGLTIRNQRQADERRPDFLQIPGNLWISFEPAEEEVGWYEWLDAYEDTGGEPECDYSNLRGIIVGHNNRRGAPGTEMIEHIRNTVEQCVTAGVAVYVKQIWTWYCPHCGRAPMRGGPRFCLGCGREQKCRLLRASHPAEYALYPEWARHRELPWEPKT